MQSADAPVTTGSAEPVTDRGFPTESLRALLSARPPRLGVTRLVALDGPSGSGKTMLAARLAAELRATVIPTDLLATWDDPFGWWPRLESQLLAPLAAGRTARLDTITWVDGVPVPGEPMTVTPPEVLVLEGVSSARLAVADRLTASVWIELPGAARRLERAVARDGESCRDPLQKWQRDEEQFFAADRTRDRADLVHLVAS